MGEELVQQPCTSPQIFEELSARITTFPSELPVAPYSSPERYFRSQGRHSEHVLTPLLVPGKVQDSNGNENICGDLESGGETRMGNFQVSYRDTNMSFSGDRVAGSGAQN